MMGKLDDLPFSRGATWFGGSFIPTTPPEPGDMPGGWNLEGKEYMHEDVTYGSGYLVRVRAVRNVGTANLLPGQLVSVSSLVGYYSEVVLPGTNPAVPTTVLNTYSFVVDEFLPPAGVVPGDLFWLVVYGPAMCKNTTDGTATLSELQKVGSCSAASVTSVDAGCIQGITAGDTALIYSNAVGRALAAVTAGGTGVQVLVGVGW